MNRETFIELTGEDPVDMFGPDWWNELHAMEIDKDDEDNIPIDDDLDDPLFDTDDE